MKGEWEETLEGILEQGGDHPRFASSLDLGMMTAICNRHNAALKAAVEAERERILAVMEEYRFCFDAQAAIMSEETRTSHE